MSAGVEIALLGARPELVAPVGEWLYAEWWQQLGLERQEARAVLANRLQTASVPLALVALSDGEAVGIASLLPGEEPRGGGAIVCLGGVFVRAPWRRRGIGARLCRHAAIVGRRLGLKRLHLFTTEAQAWYERLGWREAFQTALETRQGFELVSFLELSLDAPPFAEDAEGSG